FAHNHLNGPRGIIFGTDGNLYVADENGNTSNKGSIVRFDGTTGAFIDNFVASGSGGLAHAQYLVFGPDGNLYVSSENAQGAATVSGEILRYDGKTGAFLGTYVPSGSGGLDLPFGMTFGADGNLYVASSRGQAVLRYQGPSGNNPGAFI